MARHLVRCGFMLLVAVNLMASDIGLAWRDWAAVRQAWTAGTWGAAWDRLSTGPFAIDLPVWHRQPGWRSLVRYEEDLLGANLWLDPMAGHGRMLRAARIEVVDAAAALRAENRVRNIRLPRGLALPVKVDDATVLLGRPATALPAPLRAGGVCWHWHGWQGEVDLTDPRGGMEVVVPVPLTDRRLDATRLEKLPGNSLLVAALALGGPLWRAAVAALPAGPWDQTIPTRQGALLPMRRALAELNGTAVLLITSGSHQPGVVLDLPVSPRLDALIAGLVAKRPQQYARAHNETVPCSLMRGLAALHMRRIKGRWILGTDGDAVLHRQGKRPLWAPQVIVDSDLHEHLPDLDGLGGLVVADVDKVLAKGPGLKHLFRLYEQSSLLDLFTRLGMTARLYEGGTLADTTVLSGRLHLDTGGGRIEVEQAALPLLIIRAALAQFERIGIEPPPVGQFRQVCSAYGLRSDGPPAAGWPPAGKVATSGLTVDHVYSAPPSDRTGDRLWPVLIENPARHQGRGGYVCFADGWICWVDGDAVWRRAAAQRQWGNDPAPWAALRWRLARARAD